MKNTEWRNELQKAKEEMSIVRYTKYYYWPEKQTLQKVTFDDKFQPG